MLYIGNTFDNMAHSSNWVLLLILLGVFFFFFKSCIKVLMGNNPVKVH